MAKGKSSVFFCQNCGYESAKWMGQCPACHEWNTFAEEPAAASASPYGAQGTRGKSGGAGIGAASRRAAAKAQPLRLIETGMNTRASTGLAELDRVLGGGIVAGSLVLVGGDPGIGKSTLLLQVCRNLTGGAAADGYADVAEEEDGADGPENHAADSKTTRSRTGRAAGSGGSERSVTAVRSAHSFPAEDTGTEEDDGALQQGTVLYVSGEESPQQIKLRAQRMGHFTDRLLILCETNLSDIQEAITRLKPQVVVIDSIQTMYNENVASAPGSVSQVRESTGLLMQIAKGMGVSIFVVGHVTKEGTVAGPRVLEHMVDTVLYFEGDRHASYRILHSVKNRFGSTDEIGVFEMRAEGLREVENPSEFMLDGRPHGASGSVVACSMEGTRPILIEIQALVARTTLAYPRRTADGADVNRVNLLLAVLEKRLGLRLSSCDVYVNIAGGVRLREPALDLGIVASVISSARDIVIDEKTLVFGEIGLSGEVRSVSKAAQRVREAGKLGFTTVILPEANRRSAGSVPGVRLIGVRTVRDLQSALEGA